MKVLLTIATCFLAAGPVWAQTSQPTRMERAKGWFHLPRHHQGASKAKVAKTETVKEKALTIPEGSMVKLTSTDGAKTTGRLVGLNDTALTVKNAGTEQNRSIPFTEIDKLKQTHSVSLRRPKTQTTRRINESLAALPAGAPATLKLTDGSRVAGRYSSKTADEVTMQVPDNNRMVTRQIPRAQIAGVKQSKGKLPGLPKMQPPGLVSKTVAGLPAGSPMETTMPDGDKIAGKYRRHTDEGFTMQTLEGGNIVEKDFKYDQVANVKQKGFGARAKVPGLHPPAPQSSPDVKKAAVDIQAGSPVTVHRVDGTQLTGKLLNVNNDGVEVQSMQAGNVTDERLPFDQVGSIKQGVPATPTARARKIGITAATVIVTGIVSGALARAF